MAGAEQKPGIEPKLRVIRIHGTEKGIWPFRSAEYMVTHKIYLPTGEGRIITQEQVVFDGRARDSKQALKKAERLLSQGE